MTTRHSALPGASVIRAAAATLDETTVEYLSTVAALYGFDSTDLVRLLAAIPADALANPATAILEALSAEHEFNGTTWDRKRNNEEVTLLASAARTATLASATFTNYNKIGMLLILNITAASGTGGLQVRIQARNPITGNFNNLHPNPTALTSVTTAQYLLYPAVITPGGGLTNNYSTVVSRRYRLYVAHGDGSSYTYSVSGILL